MLTKPEFKALAGKRLCNLSVEIYTVAVTSDTTRDVVYKVQYRYDTAVVREWLNSFYKLEARLLQIPFTAKHKNTGPQFFGSDGACFDWDFFFVDPEDGDNYAIDLKECQSAINETHLHKRVLTPILAARAAQAMKLPQTVGWKNHSHLCAYFLTVLTQPVHESEPLVAHFQLFDDGWRPTEFN
jgi:hypothetical protein